MPESKELLKKKNEARKKEIGVNLKELPGPKLENDEQQNKLGEYFIVTLKPE